MNLRHDPELNVEDLQAVSQVVMTGAERIAQLEAEKRAVDPGSERFQELSHEIEELAIEIRLVSRAETDLANDLAGMPGLPTIEEADAKSG